jgi:hypothetical protein
MDQLKFVVILLILFSFQAIAEEIEYMPITFEELKTDNHTALDEDVEYVLPLHVSKWNQENLNRPFYCGTFETNEMEKLRIVGTFYTKEDVRSYTPIFDLAAFPKKDALLITNKVVLK